MASSFRQFVVCCLAAASLAVIADAADPPPANGANKPRENDTRTPEAIRASGREIFLREWIPNDPRSHGGDGLGPVFNESSCVSCHNQGGVGGGGSEAKNVNVISAVRVANSRNGVKNDSSLAPADPRITTVRPKPVPQASPTPQSDTSREDEQRTQLLADLRKLHPGLATARSVVLHNSGTDPKYTAWRDWVLGIDMTSIGPPFNRAPSMVPAPKLPDDAGFFARLIAESQHQELLEKLPPVELQAARVRGLMTSVSLLTIRNQNPQGRKDNLGVAAVLAQRNSTALFGIGSIDSISDAAIEATAARTITDFPEISGRVARLKDGRIGRFGWKAQKATLYDFTMTACAVELGLHVPDHPQAGVPLKPEYVPAGFDLNREECRDLVQFLKELPAPIRRVEESTVISNELKKGEQLFAKIGCAACHIEKLGDVVGIYSDLLLHDMGPETGDSGSYGVFQPQSSGNDSEDPLAGLLNEPTVEGGDPFESPVDSAARALKVEERLPEKMIGAGRQEWRTPPLWGVRDSAPYIHDGRAATIEQAIAAHGGEAQLSANRFFRLPPQEQSLLVTFLRSLVAPDATAK